MFGWLRKRKKPETVEEEVPDFFFAGDAAPDFYAGQAVRGAWDEYVKEGMRTAEDGSSNLGFRVMKGMNESEREEYLSLYGPWEMRKEMRRRRKARDDEHRDKP